MTPAASERQRLADELWFLVGAEGCRSHGVLKPSKSSGWSRPLPRDLGPFGGCDDGNDDERAPGPRWSHVHRPISRSAWRRAVAGKIGLSAHRIATCSMLILDVDVHELTTRDVARAREQLLPRSRADVADARSLKIDVFLHAERRDRTWARARRAANAERVARVVDCLRALVPEVLLELSPRGVHAIVLLDDAEPTQVVAKVAALLADAIDVSRAQGVAVEPFPRMEGRGGASMCRLPCTGPSRLLGEDLIDFAHTRREHDWRHVLESPRLSLSELRRRLSGMRHSSKPSRPSRRPIATHVRNPGSGETSEPAAPVRRARRGLVEEDGKLRAKTFADRLVDLARGIGEGESWEACRRFSFALVAAGLTDDEAARAWRNLVARPGHRARHCQSAGGLADLERTMESCLRRHRRFVKPRLRDQRVLAVIDDLLGRPPRAASSAMPKRSKRPPKGSWSESEWSRERDARSERARRAAATRRVRAEAASSRHHQGQEAASCAETESETEVEKCGREIERALARLCPAWGPPLEQSRSLSPGPRLASPTTRSTSPGSFSPKFSLAVESSPPKAAPEVAAATPVVDRWGAPRPLRLVAPVAAQISGAATEDRANPRAGADVGAGGPGSDTPAPPRGPRNPGSGGVVELEVEPSPLAARPTAKCAILRRAEGANRPEPFDADEKQRFARENVGEAIGTRTRSRAVGGAP